MPMDVVEKNHLLYGILEKLKIFLRPFYDNGSSLTTEGENRPTTYEPFYSKKDKK